MAALEKLVDGLGARNQVALKNALAYDRDLAFDEPDEKMARQAAESNAKAATPATDERVRRWEQITL